MSTSAVMPCCTRFMPMFTPMATAIILLTVLNFLVLRKLVNFRI